MNHHHPLLADYITTVLGYSVVVLIFLAFFIYFLFVGLKTADSRRIDPKPAKNISRSIQTEDHLMKH